MRAQIKTVLRTAQVNFPALLEFRYAAQRAYILLRGKPADSDFECLSLFQFEPDEVLVDVGANRGQTIDTFRMYHSNPIVAFEPNASLANRLKGVRVENCGLSDKPGQMTLHIPSYNGWDFDGQAALEITDDAAEYLRRSIIGFNPAKLVIKNQLCEIRTLDEFDLKAGLIKIDTEGHELAVIRGATKTIERNKPAFIVENSSPQETTDYLNRFGYEPFYFHHGLVKGLAPDARNMIYLHRSKVR